MIDTARLIELLLASGVMLAKFFGSPLATMFGVGVPVLSGLQALNDLFSRKVTFAKTPESEKPAQDVIRERLRGRVVRLWITQVAIALISAVLILWLYVVDDIPRKGTPPVATPTLLQSVLLIVLFALIALAIVVGFARVKTASASAS